MQRGDLVEVRAARSYLGAGTAGEDARRTAAGTAALPLLFRARLWGDQAGHAVVADKLAVVFAAVFDKAVGHVENADLLVGEGIDHQVVHSLIAFGFDGGAAVGEGFLYEGY